MGKNNFKKYNEFDVLYKSLVQNQSWKQNKLTTQSTSCTLQNLFSNSLLKPKQTNNEKVFEYWLLVCFDLETK